MSHLILSHLFQLLVEVVTQQHVIMKMEILMQSWSTYSSRWGFLKCLKSLAVSSADPFKLTLLYIPQTHWTANITIFNSQLIFGFALGHLQICRNQPRDCCGSMRNPFEHIKRGIREYERRMFPASSKTVNPVNSTVLFHETSHTLTADSHTLWNNVISDKKV